MTLFVDKFVVYFFLNGISSSTGSAINKTYTHPDMIFVVGWFPRATKITVFDKIPTVQDTKRVTYLYIFSSVPNQERLKRGDYVSDLLCYRMIITTKMTMMTITSFIGVRTKVSLSLKTRQITVSKEQFYR